MAKLSPKEKSAKNPKQKRQLRSSSNRYLKPGTLAQLRYSRASSSKVCVCSDIVNIPVVFGSFRKDDERVVESLGVDKSPLIMSPVNLMKQSSLVGTPKTPQVTVCESESRLESLPIDLLVMILCHLHHDQLKAVFHVSQRVRNAVLLARQCHFNYTTPDRSRQEMLSIMTPQPTDHYPFVRGSGNGVRIPTPRTPKAPRHGPRPSSRLRWTEMRQVAAVLFRESVLPSRCMVPSVLAKPICKPVASNRVLFCEDDLCQAVAQNKLL